MLARFSRFQEALGFKYQALFSRKLRQKIRHHCSGLNSILYLFFTKKGQHHDETFCAARTRAT